MKEKVENLKKKSYTIGKNRTAGITLVALVVTIVIMLILAGVSISLNTGNSSIFDQAQKAKEKNKIAQIIEYLDLKLLNNQTIHYFEGNEVIIRATQKEVEENKKDLLKIGDEVEVKEVEIDTQNNEVYFYVVVDKGVYKVTLDGTKYVGQQIEEPIEIEEGDLVADYTPTTWTNENVEITLKSNVDIPETKIVYMKEKDTNWRNYTGVFEVEENQAVRVSLQGIMIKTPPEMTVNILNIDKIKPSMSTALTSKEVNTQGFTLSVGITDELSGIGKIIWYYKEENESTYKSEEEIYQKINGADKGEKTATKEKTYTGLTSGKYEAYVEIYDVAGNKIDSRESNNNQPIIIETGEVEKAEGATYTPSTWTNGDVIVTLPSKEGYDTVYTKDGTGPKTNSEKYNKETKITLEQNTLITYAYSDKTNVGEHGTVNVLNIDKTKPVVTTANSDTKSITFTATDEASGIIGYKITTSNTAPSTFDSCSNTKNLNKTISGLKDNTLYYIWIKDEAGNISEGREIRTGIFKYPNYTFSYNPSGWTKGNVVATVTPTTALTSGTWLEVSKDTTTWTKGTSLTYENNGTMYVSVYDGTNRKTLSSTGTIANIDKIKPTVSFGTNGHTGWSTTNSTTITATDNASGVLERYGRWMQAFDTTNIPTLTQRSDFTGAGGWSFNSGETSKQNPTEGYWYLWIYVKDNAGNETITHTNIFYIDRVGPSVPTVTYNGGSNSCSWKNNYNITLSSSDSRGIAYYEVDWDGDGNANTTTGANFIPWNGYSSCNNRFRAVDNLGNRSGWTDVHHIHMDTEAPGKTSVNLNGYSSGSWTNGNVTQSFSATDNIGIAYYQYSHDAVNPAGNLSSSWVINWDGQWNFYIRAVDHAGNAGAWSDMYTIRRDTQGPTEVVTWSRDVSTGYVDLPIKQGERVHASAVDSLSGVNRFEFSRSNGGSVEYTRSATGSGSSYWVDRSIWLLEYARL